MRTFLKYLIGILIVLALAAMALMYFSPKQMVVDNEIVIDGPPTVVYNMVNNFQEWENWSAWLDNDPAAVTSYTDKLEGIGAQWSWKGNKEVGEGSQKIVESVTNEKVKTALELSNWSGVSYSDWTLTPDGDKTKVQWQFEGAEKSFFMRPVNLLMKSGLKNTAKKSMKRLKKLVEDRQKNKEYNGYKMNEVFQGTKHYVMNRGVVNLDKVSQFYTQNITSLFSKSRDVKLEMDGKDSALFYSWDESNGQTDMAAALAVTEPVAIPNAISQTISESKVIQVDYYGDRNNTDKAHRAIRAYMKDQGLLINYPIVEEYITDPTEEKDPAKWLTKVTYYITKSTQE